MESPKVIPPFAISEELPENPDPGREWWDAQDLMGAFADAETNAPFVLRDAGILGDFELRDRSISEVVLSDVVVHGELLLSGLDVEQLRLTSVRAERIKIEETHIETRAVIHLPCFDTRASPTPARASPWAAESVELERVAFGAGAALRLGAPIVSLKRTVFGGPSVVLGDWNLKGPKPAKPILTDLVLASVSNVRFIGWDLTMCRFYGAQGLNEATFAASCDWLTSPGHRPRRCLFDEVLHRMRSTASPEYAVLLGAASPTTWRHRIKRPARAWLDVRSYPPQTFEDASYEERWWTEVTRRLRQDRPETFHAWEVETLYQSLARGSKDQGKLAVAADYLVGAHTARLLASKTPNGRRQRDRVGRGLVRLFSVFGGLGVRAHVPLFWLLALVVGFGISLSVSGFREGGAYCVTKSSERARLAGPTATLATPSVIPAPARLILCTDDVGFGEIEELAGAVSVSAGLLAGTSRATATDVEPWAQGAVGPARVLSLLLIGFAGLAIRNRVAGG